jgi:hypothetical protein
MQPASRPIDCGRTVAMIPSFSVRTPSVAETMRSYEVEPIGTVAGKQYARHKDGRELLIGSPVMPWEGDNPPGPSEVHIERREKVQTREMAFPEMRTTTIRATVVPAGSYEKAKVAEQARQEANARRANPGYRPVDALAAVHALAPRQGQYVIGDQPRNPLLSQSTPGLAIPGRPAIRGPREIIDYLTGKGLRLEVTPDGTGVLVRAKSGRLDSNIREAIRATARLLAGELTGSPVSCELCHDRRPAVTILEVDVAVPRASVAPSSATRKDRSPARSRSVSRDDLRQPTPFFR